MPALPGQPVGIEAVAGSPIPRDRSPASAGSAAIPLIDELPTYEIVRGYFREITVAASAAATGDAAWFGLQRFRIDEDSGQELAMLGAWADLRPPDVSAGATSPTGGTVLAWGNAAGDDCAIVVGLDLPIEFQQWSYAPAHLPGMIDSELGLLAPRGRSPYLWHTTFPSGQYTDTIPQRNIPAISTAPLVRRLTRGRSLDIAFVTRPAYLTGAGVFVGFADVSVVVGRRRAAEAFQT